MSGCNGNGRCPFSIPLITATFSINKLWIYTLLVIFVFPHTSYEIFEFGGAVKSGSVGATIDAIKPIGKRPFEKKFKFHKIERVHFDDVEGQDDEDSADSAGTADDDKNDDVDKNKKRNDDDDTSQPIDASEQATESEELPFKRVRTSHKERRTATSSPTKSNGEKRSSSKRRRDSAHGDAEKSEESQSFFRSLFGNLFGGETSRNEKLTSEEDKYAEKKKPSNSIIDWLKWLSERRENVGSHEAVKNEETDVETWLSYFNRWPFNTLFNIGKPAKPIRLPRSGRELKQTAAFAEDGDSDGAAPAMSQENFETVLHTLPSFVVDPSQVDNTECRQQLQIFHRQLRGNKLWTLQSGFT